MASILIKKMDLSEERHIIITKKGEVLRTDYRGISMPTDSFAVEVKPHGDLISRQDVIEVLKDACEEGCNDIYANGVRRAIFDEVLEVVEDKEILPTVLEASNGSCK